MFLIIWWYPLEFTWFFFCCRCYLAYMYFKWKTPMSICFILFFMILTATECFTAWKEYTTKKNILDL